MGDVLQFMRYQPWVKQRGGEIVVEVHPPLVPLLSLPGVLHSGNDAIPHTLPYIETGNQCADLWESHIRQDLFNIGLVWASSDTDPRRNLPLDRCRAWFQSPKLHFISEEYP